MCPCCYWGIPYNILLSQLNRLVPCHFIMSKMYIITTSWEHNQRKRNWGHEPLSNGYRGRSPLRNFLGSKGHLDRLNDTRRENFVLLNSVQKFIEIQAWLLLTFFPMFTQSINFYIEYCYIIKEYRCLKNVIYQLERNEWLVRSAFQ